jgi:hypothetical protein
MPDPAKHEALAGQGFKIARVCQTCEWWQPSGGGSASWGRCALITYEHGKHSGSMKAGTPALGTCRRHTTSLPVLAASVGEDYAARYAEDDPA